MCKVIQGKNSTNLTTAILQGKHSEKYFPKFLAYFWQYYYWSTSENSKESVFLFSVRRKKIVTSHTNFQSFFINHLRRKIRNIFFKSLKNLWQHCYRNISENWRNPILFFYVTRRKMSTNWWNFRSFFLLAILQNF